MQTIRDIIPHAKGIKELRRASFDVNQQCPACMVAKAHLVIRPRSREHAQRPLELVFMDIMSSSVPSIEGYNFALIIADDASMCPWVYDLKEKSDANAAARKWICDIAGLRARHVLQLLIQDNAGELKSAESLQTARPTLSRWVCCIVFLWHMNHIRMGRQNH